MSRIIPKEQLDAFLDPADVRPKGEQDAVKQVLSFLEDCQISEEDGDVLVALMQQSRGSGTQQDVSSFPLRAGDDLQEIAQEIVDYAVRDAREGGCSGKVRYAVKASGRRGRKSFLLTFPSNGDDDYAETPNERGALSQVMRQNSELHTTVVSLVQDFHRTSKQVIDQLMRANAKHEELAGKNFAIYADLVTAQHERQLMLTKADRSEKRMDEVAGFLMTAGQLVFNTFMGERVFNKAPTAIEHQTYAFASTWDQEQIQAATTGQPLVLRPDQALGLFQLMKNLDEQYRAMKAGEAPPPQAFDPNAGQNGAPPPPHLANGSANGAYANGHANGHTNHPPHADNPASAAT